jgi:hypothetical protein
MYFYRKEYNFNLIYFNFKYHFTPMWFHIYNT